MTLQDFKNKYGLSGLHSQPTEYMKFEDKTEDVFKDVEKLLKAQKDLPIGIDEWINQGIKYGYSNYQSLTKDKEFLFKIGMLRQWLNEDRISDPSKMVSNEDLLNWFK